MRKRTKNFFIKEKKKLFLGRFTLSEMAKKMNVAKGNLSNILNGKQYVSKYYAYFIVSISNKLNNNDYDVEFYFEEEAEDEKER